MNESHTVWHGLQAVSERGNLSSNAVVRVSPHKIKMALYKDSCLQAQPDREAAASATARTTLVFGFNKQQI